MSVSEALSVLIIDDDREALFALEALLESRGFSVTQAESGERAIEALNSKAFDLIVCDVQMPDMSGIQVAEFVKSHPEFRFIPLALLTANSDLESVLAGLNAGADTYILKPYRADELVARVHALVRSRSLFSELRTQISENKSLRALAGSKLTFANIIGASNAMQELFAFVEKVKDSPLPVLITGESGTGKELFARAIHFQSIRKSGPFIAQNCSAFSEHLLESELFGHVKGAFTGALRDKQGLFEAAHQGTLFLDELGEMSLPLQAKLLRVLQDGSFIPVGSTVTKKVDVRVVAATHRNLPEMIKNGSFREDLFYRLNVIGLKLPPLRERREDIPMLVDHFLRRCSERASAPPKKLSSTALSHILAYDWPGNIRELENELERSNLMSSDGVMIDVPHLSSHLQGTGSTKVPSPPTYAGGSLKDALEVYERQLIAEALERSGGNKSKTAEELQVSRTSLIKKVQQFGL